MQQEPTVDSTEQINAQPPEVSDDATPKADEKIESSDADGKKAFERLKSDMFKYKEELREAKRALKEKEEADLRKRQEWQRLAELKEEEARNAIEERDTLRGSIVRDKKTVAVKEACLALGIDKNAMSDIDLLDLEDVDIETTSTGRINVIGASQFAERLKATRPHWFRAKRGDGVHVENPEVVSGGDVTYDQLMKAEQKARETGDYAPYEKLIRKYQTQLQRR